MLPCSVVCDSPVQVRPVIVMQEVSIDSLQQQVRTFWGESWEVRVFFWRGGILPHASDLDRGPRGVSLSLYLSSFSSSYSSSSSAFSSPSLATTPPQRS